MATNSGVVNLKNTLNEELDPKVARNLRLWNIGAAVAQLASGIVICILTDKSKTFPWYTSFPQDIDRDNVGFLVPAPQQVASIAVGYFSGAFLLLSALDHLIVALPPFNNLYNWNIANYQNQFRWTEYSFSASLMHVEIAMISGITDIHLLFCIFGLTMVTMIFGGIFESDNAEARAQGGKIRWAGFWAGCVPHMFNWSVILCYFFRNVSASGAPGFVWAIIIVIFVLDLTFAINLLLQWRGTWRWKSYAWGEWTFIILSLTSKQLLAWLNFGGSMR